jgi:NAD(P)-dependent dehydrogenase (short-subunit alcohol dehydrogenase family)
MSSESNGTLAGRTVLITGAGSGIGKATCLVAAAQGAHVVALDVKGQDETLAELQGAGGPARHTSSTSLIRARGPAWWNRS